MESLGHLLSGFAAALSWYYLLYAFAGCMLGTLIGVLPGLGPAAGTAILIPLTFSLDADRRHHHAERHLLRRDVWRHHHLGADQRAGRSGLGGDLHRRPSDGAPGPCRLGARHRRHRFFRRRHAGHGGARRRRHAARHAGAEVRTGRVLRPDGGWPLPGRRSCRQEHPGGAADDRDRPAVRHDRPRSGARRAALHLRRRGAVRRHRLCAGRHGPVRRRRAPAGGRDAADPYDRGRAQELDADAPGMQGLRRRHRPRHR